MDEELKKRLAKDTDGLLTYEYIANHIGECDDIIGQLVDNMIKVDPNGQFTVSAARYLAAIGREKYAPQIDALIAAAIDKDRERPLHRRSAPEHLGRRLRAARRRAFGLRQQLPSHLQAALPASAI